MFGVKSATKATVEYATTMASALNATVLKFKDNNFSNSGEIGG
jgi:hypothetical protein